MPKQRNVFFPLLKLGIETHLQGVLDFVDQFFLQLLVRDKVITVYYGLAGLVHVYMYKHNYSPTCSSLSLRSLTMRLYSASQKLANQMFAYNMSDM